MPNVDRLDSLADVAALEKEKEQILSGLKEIKDFIGKIGAIEFKAKGAKSMADNVKVTNELTAAMKEQQKIENQLAKASEQLAQIQEKIKKLNDDQLKGVDAVEKAKKRLANTESKQAKELAFYNAQIAENNKLNKLRAESENAVAGSIEAARAKVKELTQQRNILNLSTEAGRKKAAELNAEIDKQNDFIKANVDALAKQKINIGNYEGSAKIIVDALEKARQKFDALSKSADASPAALQRAKTEFEALRSITDNKQFLNFSGTMGDATKEVRTFTRTLVNLESQGLGNSEVAQELRKRLAELTDTIADTRAEVKALSSDSRSVDLFASSVNFAIDVFQTAAGAMIAFGASEEDAAEATKTLLALQTLSNGVQGIANELTTKGTAANKLYAFALNQVTIATDASVAATTRLRAALITVGIGALIIGIGLLIKFAIDYRAKLAASTKAQEEFNKALEEQNSDAAKEITNLKLLTSAAADATRPYKDRLSAVKKLREQFGPYFKELKDEQILNGEVAKSVEAAKKAILERAKARAIEGQIAKETEAQLNLFLKRQRIVQNIAEQERKLAVARDQAAKGEATSLRRTLLGTLLEIDQQIMDSGANMKALLDRVASEDIKPPAIDNTEQEKANKKFYDGELKAQADAFKKLSENEEGHLITRLSAREKAFELEKEILAGQRNVEIQNAEGNAAKILEINTEYAEKRKDLQRDLDTDVLNIHQSFIAQQRELEREANDQFLKEQEDALAKQIDNLQDVQEDRFKEQAEGREAELKSLNKWYQDQVNATREGSKEREKVEQEYAERRADIEYSYAVAALKTQIKFAEKLIKVNKDANKNVAQQEKELAKLNIQLSDLETNHIVENNKRQAKSHQDKLEKIKSHIETAIALTTNVGNIINELFSIGADKQKARIEEQLSDIEKRKEKEIEAINVSAATEEEKANRIALVNARTAAQQAELERRKRQQEIQKARLDKASNIANIISSTALAVVTTLADRTITPGFLRIPLAFTVGALGAAQLVRAIAAPIPKLKEGRDSGPATLAITGDGGVPEVMTSPDMKQAFLTPATDTLTYLPKDWKVFSDVGAFNEAALKLSMKPLPVLPVISTDDGKWSKAVAFEIRDLKEVVKNKPVTHISGNHAGVMGVLQYGSTWIEYVDQNVNF